MILLGSGLAAIAAAAIVLAARPASGVMRTLDLVAAPAASLRRERRRDHSVDLRHARVRLEPDRLIALRAACALGAALLAALGSLLVPVGPLVVLAAGYLGFIAPAVAISRRAAAERRAAERAATILVERLEALVAAGRPQEAALALLMARPRRSAHPGRRSPPNARGIQPGRADLQDARGQRPRGAPRDLREAGGGARARA